MKLLRINVGLRSLPQIFIIRQYVELLGVSFPMIGITESWLKDINDPIITIPDYSLMKAFAERINEVME